MTCLTRLATFSRTSVWRVFSVLLLCLACLSLFMSSTASAYNINADYMGSYQISSGWLQGFSGTRIDGFKQFYGGISALQFNPNGMALSHFRFVTNKSFVSGSVVSFYILTQDVSATMLQVNSDSIAILDSEVFYNETSSHLGSFVRFDILVKNEGINYFDFVLSSSGTSGFIVNSIVIFPASYWTIKNINLDTLENNTQQILDEIKKLNLNFDANGIIGAINSGNVATQNAINNAANQAHSDAEAQRQATEAQTQQQKDQYDQEKQEEADRENSAKDDGNSLLGIFNITLLNPFAGIWEMFNAGGCTNIPTIAGWVGSEDTTYCSWWPQSIRATLTPVFSIASMMLLFGFVMRWLGGSESIEVSVPDGFHEF